MTRRGAHDRGRSGCQVPAAALVVVIGLSNAVETRQTEPPRLYGGAAAASLVGSGVLLPAPADLTAFAPVPAPGLRSVRNDAQATIAPWVDSNGWRFERGLRRVRYDTLPAGSAALAAAEAFVFGVDAVLNPDPADVEVLGRMVAFLNAHRRPAQTALADIGVIDDGSPEMGEALNMLTRRNLLYRVVAKPDPSMDLTVEVGTPRFPRGALANPSDLAARVREALGDDRRLVRVYGSSTVIVRLTGDAAGARLHVVSYSRNGSQPSIRIRVAGRYRPAALAAYGAGADASVLDLRHPDDMATEFSLPAFTTVALVDLEPLR